MSDTRSLVFPMTARDVVVSVLLVALPLTTGQPRADVWEVVSVEHLGATPNRGGDAVTTQVTIYARDGADNLRKLELHPDTPLLLTGISRR